MAREDICRKGKVTTWGKHSVLVFHDCRTMKHFTTRYLFLLHLAHGFLSVSSTLCKSSITSISTVVTFNSVSATNWTFCLSLRFCGGLVLDVKRKLPFFASDFYDALHIQSLSTILFIYLGTVTNAITFGGLLGDATENMQVTLSNPPPTNGKLKAKIKAADITVFF